MTPILKGMKKLTKRELEILILICKWASSKEIALELNISSDTVNQHRKSLKSKLSARNVAELCYIAAKNILIPPKNGD
jgi:two-component system invasion response regulator UvrY